MLIVMQYFLVRLIFYSLTFKCRGFTAVVLFVLTSIFRFRDFESYVTFEIHH